MGRSSKQDPRASRATNNGPARPPPRIDAPNAGKSPDNRLNGFNANGPAIECETAAHDFAAAGGGIPPLPAFSPRGDDPLPPAVFLRRHGSLARLLPMRVDSALHQ